ncbi:hypothetical protein [Streptomyces wuyuanensis]|uniref:hypothetical protein n=1 Tax=Streptomyces wuyuanensis TaxID=1196353 RepID=UPI00341F86B5
MNSEPVQSVEEYRSETLIIERHTTQTHGAYFLVVESDISFPEDEEALARLTEELGAAWGSKSLESECTMQPHPEMPWSECYTIHVVHAECPEVGRPRNVVDVELIGTVKSIAFTWPGPWVRDKEDLPHEDALPDLYGLPYQRRREVA